MPNRPYAEREWRVGRRIGGFWTGKLMAYWELDCDAVSDGYTPQDIGARELLALWAVHARQRHPDELIPISWYVKSNGAGRFESAPFQYGRDDGEDFLTFYEWPVDALTGQRMEWLRLPVMDKAWNLHEGMKGGFIQEVTGWKPSMLQPTLYLPTVLSIFAAAA